MEVEWPRIIEKPDAKYKVDGSVLLKFRIQGENLQKELDSLKKKYLDLETQYNQQKATNTKLQSLANEQQVKIEKLQKELQDSTKEYETLLKELATQKEKEFEEKTEAQSAELNTVKTELEKASNQFDTTQNQLSELQNQCAEIQKQLKESEKQLNEKSSQIDELSAKNQDLEKQIAKVGPKLAETDEIKAKIEKFQTELEDKNSEISQLNNKIQEMEKQKETEISSLKEQHLKEMETQKTGYKQQILELKTKIGFAREEIKISEEEKVIYLRFTGEDFRYVPKKPDEGIILILDKQEEKWLLVWDAKSSLIDRRTAERIARSIAKAGWTLPGGGRVGMGFKIELQGEKTMPERLLRDQHKYME